MSVKTTSMLAAAAMALTAHATSATQAEPPGAQAFLIGLDADFGGPLNEVSIAVRQGAEAAVEVINAAGGVDGRPLALMVTNHRSNPRRARDNFEDGVAAGIVAMISGAQSTAALAPLEHAQAAGVPLISSFPTSTGITSNGLTPNPAFRVSARDVDTNAFLVEQALKTGKGRIALLIENSKWGDSNHEAANRAIEASDGGEVVATGWFALGGEGFTEALITVMAAQPDVVLLFGKPAQGVGLLEAFEALPEAIRPRALLHWGVAQGKAFGRAAAAVEGVEYGVFQTFNFDRPHDPEAAATLLAATCRLHGVCDAEAALTPSPMAQAWDTVHLIALGLTQVQAGAAPDLLTALQALPPHEGLVRRYDPAFTVERREALDESVFMLARYVDGGRPVPVTQMAPDGR